MPRRRPPKSATAAEMFDRIGKQLTQAADEPNLLRYSPHSKQLMFHELRAKHRLFLGGNRSGKSVAGTAEGLYRARGDHPNRLVPPGPTRGRVVGTDFTMGIQQVLLPLWQQWTPPSMLINGSWEDSYHYGEEGRILTFANGSTVEFMSYEQDVQKFSGASRHWIHFDEEPPRDVYDESRARLVDTDGDWWMTLTPVLGLDFIYDEVYIPGKHAMEHPEDLTPDQFDEQTGLPLFGVVEVESFENTHLRRSALEGFFSTLDESSRETRRTGRFVQVTGAVFPDFDRDRHIIPDMFRPRNGYHRVYVSIDNGWRDHTAVLWHAVDPHDNVTTFDELYINHTLIRDIAAQIRQKNAVWGISRPYVYVGDPRGLRKRNEISGTNALMEFARNGIPIATEGINGDVEFGVQRMTQYLRTPRRAQERLEVGDHRVTAVNLNTPKWVVVGTRCPNLTRQLEKNRWRRRANASDERTMNKLIEIQQTDNHATDSARFFFVMMPDLAPKRTTVDERRDDAQQIADMLGAVKPDTRRDPKHSLPPSQWKYRPTKALGEFEGWEEG